MQFMGSPQLGGGNDLENYTEEEQQMIMQVEAEKQARQQALREKTQSENTLKAEK